jgi:hypothetical protein
MMGSASNKTRMTELIGCSLKYSEFPAIREQINSIRVLGVELRIVVPMKHRNTLRGY